jgi:beta-lactamase class A
VSGLVFRDRLPGLAVLGFAALAFLALIHDPASGPAGLNTGRAPQAASARAALLGARTESLDTQTVDAKLLSDVANAEGNYGVAAIDLASGRMYGVNGTRTFRAASVNKVPILISLYDRSSRQGLNLSQVLTIDEPDIQHYGTGTIQQPGAPRTYSLAQLARLMTQVSDNTAAYVLERKLGQASIEQDLRRWGAGHTSMAGNTTTPADVATLLANLYGDRLLPPDATDSVLNLLEQTVFDDRLASGIPAGTVVAHKVGTDVGVYNDAAIILVPGRPYVAVVFSEDADESQASEIFNRVSRDLYEFESSFPPVR